MICDAQKPLCMAGIYGGIDSGVTIETSEILLECATFHPVWVRKSSRNHNLKTDSSFRFERGTDPDATLYTLQRAADLIVSLAGGKLHPGGTDFYPIPAEPVKMFYRWADMDRLVGEAIPRDAAKKIHARGIDILIDLTGFTQNCRSGIVALRPAPISINWLGFPGTMGAFN
jgi:phenylalanyl-tRNA synthetase beta chain